MAIPNNNSVSIIPVFLDLEGKVPISDNAVPLNNSSFYSLSSNSPRPRPPLSLAHKRHTHDVISQRAGQVTVSRFGLVLDSELVNIGTKTITCIHLYSRYRIK